MTRANFYIKNCDEHEYNNLNRSDGAIMMTLYCHLTGPPRDVNLPRDRLDFGLGAIRYIITTKQYPVIKQNNK